MAGIQTERKDSDPRQPENHLHRKRKPLVAFLLSLITPGLGHMYNGEIKKAIFFFVVFDVLIVTLSLAGVFFSVSGAVVGALVFIGLYVFGLIDATFTGRKLREISLRAYNRWYFYVAIWLVSNFIILPMTSSVLKGNVIKDNL